MPIQHTCFLTSNKPSVRSRIPGSVCLLQENTASVVRSLELPCRGFLNAVDYSFIVELQLLDEFVNVAQPLLANDVEEVRLHPKG